MYSLKWQVIAECEAKNDGKVEKFERVVAVFNYNVHAQEFIEKCLPKENRNRYRVERIEEREV